jgi:hypothetical protein
MALDLSALLIVLARRGLRTTLPTGATERDAALRRVMRVRAGRLDLAHLAEWARAPGVADLLERASGQAG